MLKVIDVCTRVEGHGDIKILIQNDEISNIEFEVGVLRGFNKILIEKKLIDLPRIVSHICGLCHASQTIVSCKAIENLYDSEISEQSILIRRLLLTGELIKSHSMHFFFQSFPDLLNIFNIEKNIIGPYDLIKYNPQLTTFMYELIKIGNDINKIFGGKSVQLINLLPGGIIYYPSNKNLTLAKRYFQKAQANLEWILETFINLFSSHDPPKEFSVGSGNFIGLHNHGKYDRYSGIIGIKKNEFDITNFLAKNYSNYFDKDEDLSGITIGDKENALVGPFSRQFITENYDLDAISEYLNLFKKEWKQNILFTNFLRLAEMFVETNLSLKILEDPCLNKKMEFPPLRAIKQKDGIGVLEAPRGLLIHHYHLNDKNIVDTVKLFIPTEFNIPLINKMITDYGRDLYEKTGDINLVKKKAQMIIRAFDPCISCATY